ncbi:MAG TPA: DUF4389 domain-containing protein [Solirubrobacterales bacterium]|jgi:hypothetical protein|nr:DUF4389 domain-containing protein [Solirubrobacterales bacterium]
MNPISFDATYDIPRSRLTTFFRLIIVIPWAIWASIYGIGALVVVIIAWFAMLFTGRYPEGMYKFVAGYLRLATRVYAYALLLTDELPSFSGRPEPDYPVKVDVAPRQERYHRAKTFFKYVLWFPQMLIGGYGLALVVQFAAFISWFRILVTGKQSITMHEALVGSTAYLVRSNGFILLLTETHPRMLDVPRYQPPPDAPGLPPPTQPAPAAEVTAPPPSPPPPPPAAE